MPNSRTPVISVASTKSGVGKTTRASALASSSVNRMTGTSEYQITCIDTDLNRTLDTSLRKAEAELCEERVTGTEAMHRSSVHEVSPLTR